MLMEISWGARFNGTYFIRFGLRMGEILNFKYFVLENSNRSQKSGVGRKINWEYGHAWRSTIQFNNEDLGCTFGIVGKISMNKI
jgi:hypothetical protein